MSEARIDVVIGPEPAQSGATAVTQAIERIKQSARVLEAHMAQMAESMGTSLRGGAMVAGVAVVGVAAAVAESTRVTLQYSQQIGRMAQATNLSAQEASEFAYAAKFADTSVNSLTSGLNRLNQNIGEARAGTGDGAQLFRALGVSITDANGKVRGTGDVFREVIGKVGEFRNDAAKSSIVAKLLGDDLQQMARLGKAGLSELAQEARALGVVLSEEDLQAAEHFKQQITRLEATLMGLKLRIGEAVLPTINTLLDKLTELATGRPVPTITPPSGGGGQAPPLGQPGEDRKRIDAERARREKALQDDFTMVQRGLQVQAQLYDDDAKQRFIAEEDLAKFKASNELKIIAEHGDSLNRQLELEYEFHQRVLGIAGLTTKDRIAEDERYRNKVFDINQEILKVRAEAVGQQQLAEGKLFEGRERDRRKALDDTQTYYQGEIDMANARFANDQQLAQLERGLLREQLAFKLRISAEEADRLIAFRKNNDFEGVRQIEARADPTLTKRAVEGIRESAVAQDIRATERANGDLFAGWQRGMQDYMQRADVGFNFATDQARRAAQSMEQGFQTFFFDAFEGKMKSFKDVLGGVRTFTKQIIAQMAAQMATVGLLKGIGLSGFGSTGSGPLSINGTALTTLRFGGVVPIEHFAAGGVGGVTSRPQHMALGRTIAEFGEGPQAEAFVPLPDGRSIPVTLTLANTPMAQATGSGAVSNTINITVNASATKASTTNQTASPGAAPNFAQLARDLSKLVEAKLIEEQRPGGLLATRGA